MSLHLLNPAQQRWHPWASPFGILWDSPPLPPSPESVRTDACSFPRSFPCAVRSQSNVLGLMVKPYQKSVPVVIRQYDSYAPAPLLTQDCHKLHVVSIFYSFCSGQILSFIVPSSFLHRSFIVPSSFLHPSSRRSYSSLCSFQGP